MKQNRLFLIITLAFTIPFLALSCKDDQSKDESSASASSASASTEEVSTKKAKKKLILGEYELEKESIEAFFGQDIIGDFEKQGAKVDLKSSFNFKDDDSFDSKMVFNTRIPIVPGNEMKIDMTFNAGGTWEHNQQDTLLTVNINKVDIGNMDISFTKEDSYAKAIRKQFGTEEKMKEELIKQIGVEKDMEGFKGMQIFKVTRLQKDGFTILNNATKKRARFQKVNP